MYTIFSWRRSEVQFINSYQIAKWLGSERSILIWRKRPNILGQWSDNSVYINLLENHCWKSLLITLMLVNCHQNLLPTSIWSIQLTLSYEVSKGWYLIEKVNDKVAKLISKTEKMAKASPIKSTNLQSEMKTFKNKIKGTILSFSEPPEPSGRFTQWLC